MWWQLVLIVVLAHALALGQTTSQPATGPGLTPIGYVQEVREDPPLHIHVVRVELDPAQVELAVARGGDDPDGKGPWMTVLQTVRAVAQREQFDLAINGDFFIHRQTVQMLGQVVKYPLGDWARVIGPAMSDGKLWSLGDGRARPMLVVDEEGKVSIGVFDQLPVRAPARARQVISGNYRLVHNGQPSWFADERAPRTAVGIDKDGMVLTIMVVDGRRPAYSVGMTPRGLAEEMAGRGCWSALNLDGGGSSTLVMREEREGGWKVMNRPSDGHDLMIPLSVERPVASVLGIRLRRAATQP